MLENNYQSTQQKCILLVDDDDDLREQFRAVFEMEDYNVYTASNGKEAVDMLRTIPESEFPDVIMLDYMMPVMNGEKFSQVRDNDPRLRKIPVILMTANRDISQIMKKVKVNAFVEKPMDMDNLIRLAENYSQIHQMEAKRTLH